MSHIDHLKKLGAPITNSRKSWGAVRERDGTVFLVVWQSDVARIEANQFVQVTHRQRYADDPQNYGLKERLAHVESVAAGARCYLVMCQAKDPAVLSRTVKDFERENVFLGGRVVEHDGELWIGVGGRVPFEEAR